MIQNTLFMTQNTQFVNLMRVKTISPSFSEIRDFLPMVLKIHVFEGKMHQIHDSKNEILHLETCYL